MRRLGAIGTLVWDRIVNPFTGGESPREQWGGAAYSFASLDATCPPGWRVEPIVKIGRDLEAEAIAYLRTLPSLSLGAGVRVVSAPNNRVELRYQDPGHRVEIQSGGVPPWEWAELEPLLDGLDALYVNFLSGFELDLDTARRLRRAFRGPIYADLHSLFLSPPEVRPRRLRTLPDWEEWLACFDAVQLNEVELGLLARGSAAPDPDAFALSLLRHGPSLALVTLGARGACFVAREDLPANPLRWADALASSVRTATLPPPGGAVAGDPTGCGDVWGGACFASLLGGLPLERAVQRAQRLAAAKIAHPATVDLHEHLGAILAGE